MSIIPTKQMKDAYEKLTQTSSNEVIFGKNKEHKLTYKVHDDVTHIIEYTHYDTKVCVLTLDIDTYKRYIYVSPYAFSNTDRDNINGLLYLEDEHRVKAVRKGDEIYLKSTHNNLYKRYPCYAPPISFR